MKKKALLLFFLLFFLFSTMEIVSIVNADSGCSPNWMQTGTFCTYLSESSSIGFADNSFVLLKDNKSVIYRWECKSITNNTATLEISLQYNVNNSQVILNSSILVDTRTKCVYLLNGSNIGQTRLWMEPTPVDGQNVTIWDVPPEHVGGTITSIVYGKTLYCDTPEGQQAAFLVQGSGTIKGVPIASSATYEFDTGIMINGNMLNDPTLLSINVKNISSRLELLETNIDLGPKETMFEILSYIPAVAISVAIITILGVLLFRLRKRKKMSHAR
ncbi:MAG: hypothetical protein NWF05_07410 [Candidatus Bathyarchaeota archaeon]|nr:hypothetical protein [Candidatus Bathyarchaeota archaeon]